VDDNTNDHHYTTVKAAATNIVGAYKDLKTSLSAQLNYYEEEIEDKNVGEEIEV
jgi:hypothetical protein